MGETASRFSAVGRVYGAVAGNRIATSHVCVIGIGGVGSWVVEALARSGIGEITIIDHDDVSESNINRQVHADTSTIDRSKVEVMRERIALINSECRCHAVDDMLVNNNLERYIDQRYDYVIDAMDNIRFKAGLIYHCKKNKIKMLTIGGAGGRTDPRKIEIDDLARTWNDALAAKVRRTLHSHYGWKNRKRFRVQCVFSTEQPRYPTANGEMSYSRPGVAGVTLDCDTGYGSLVSVTASFGFIAAAHVMNELAEKAPV